MSPDDDDHGDVLLSSCTVHYWTRARTCRTEMVPKRTSVSDSLVGFTKVVAPKSGLKSGGKSGHPTLFCHTILDPILQLNPVSKFGSKIGWGLLRSFERGTRGRSRAAGVAGASRTPTSSAKNLLETPRCVDPCKNIAPLAVMITT